MSDSFTARATGRFDLATGRLPAALELPPGNWHPIVLSATRIRLFGYGHAMELRAPHALGKWRVLHQEPDAQSLSAVTDETYTLTEAWEVLEQRCDGVRAFATAEVTAQQPAVQPAD
jgi:hypothetical protein